MGRLRGHPAVGNDGAQAAHPGRPAAAGADGAVRPAGHLDRTGDLVVTDDAFRTRIEQSSLAGPGFRPVEKTHIVRLDWERWDQAAADPQEYPDGGEPEGYILDRPHDPELAAQIGPLWEVMLPGTGDKTEADLVRDQQATRHFYASQRAQDWLEQNAGEWISFADRPSPPAPGAKA